MPLTIFDVKGIPGARRERIKAAVGGRRETPERPLCGLDRRADPRWVVSGLPMRIKA